MSKLKEFNGLFEFKSKSNSNKFILIKESSIPHNKPMHGMAIGGWIYGYVDTSGSVCDLWSIKKIEDTGEFYCSNSQTTEVDAWFEQQELLKEVKEATPITTIKTRSL